MSSLFNALFGAFAAPSLMTYMGTQQAITLMLGDVVLLENADCIVRHAETLDEFDSSGNEIKRLSMEVDLLVDDGLTYGGLADEYTNAVAILDGLRWSVDRIGNKTDTFQRLRLVRKEPRGKRRSGFYRE